MKGAHHVVGHVGQTAGHLGHTFAQVLLNEAHVGRHRRRRVVVLLATAVAVTEVVLARDTIAALEFVQLVLVSLALFCELL